MNKRSENRWKQYAMHVSPCNLFLSSYACRLFDESRKRLNESSYPRPYIYIYLSLAVYVYMYVWKLIFFHGTNLMHGKYKRPNLASFWNWFLWCGFGRFYGEFRIPMNPAEGCWGHSSAQSESLRGCQLISRKNHSSVNRREIEPSSCFSVRGLKWYDLRSRADPTWYKKTALLHACEAQRSTRI